MQSNNIIDGLVHLQIQLELLREKKVNFLVLERILLLQANWHHESMLKSNMVVEKETRIVIGGVAGPTSTSSEKVCNAFHLIAMLNVWFAD